MKTAEVAIEHVLTGMLALCAFLLPLLSGLKVDEKLLQGEALFGVLGLAYLFGVVFDRLADTILSPIEEWLRLRLACEFRGKNKSGDEHDPFPQDRLEYCLRGEDGRIEWMDSLRSRIRFCHACDRSSVMGLVPNNRNAYALYLSQAARGPGREHFSVIGYWQFLARRLVASECATIRHQPGD